MDEGKKGGDLRLFVVEGKLAGQIFARVFTCFWKRKQETDVSYPNMTHISYTGNTYDSMEKALH